MVVCDAGLVGNKRITRYKANGKEESSPHFRCCDWMSKMLVRGDVLFQKRRSMKYSNKCYSADKFSRSPILFAVPRHCASSLGLQLHRTSRWRPQCSRIVIPRFSTRADPKLQQGQGSLQPKHEPCDELTCAHVKVPRKQIRLH